MKIDTTSGASKGASFELGQYLDVKDTSNQWRVAEVIDMKDKGYKIQVRFEGWSDRYDEVSILFCMMIFSLVAGL
jgi:hypothetical protein